MNFCKRLFCVGVSFFICLGVFSGVSLGASASATTQTLTPQETRELVGATIPAKYYSGSGYTDFTFSYGGTVQIQSVTSQPLPSFAAGDTVLYYVADLVSVDTSPQYITVDLSPQYSFFDTEEIHQFIGLSSNHSLATPATSVYAPPSWRWHNSLTGDVIVENQSTYNSGANYAYFRSVVPLTSGSLQVDSTFVEASFSSQSTFSAYSYRACFYGNSLDNGKFFFFVSCPTISASSTMASGTGIGTTSSGGGSGDVNVTVDVDLTETNTFLGSILNFLQSLLAGIAGLFVPTHEDFLQWLDDLHNLLRKHFGALIDSMLIIDSVFESIEDFSPTGNATLTIPADFTAPGVPLTFTQSEWSMQLVPTGLAWLRDIVRDFISICCTIAFLNMCRNRWEHFLDPDSPET